jgi:CheY-like chemotaxis protein
MTSSMPDRQFESCDVLVVDDDFALAEAIRHFLDNSGIRVRKAHSASEALDIIAFTPPRVAILDYQLPGANGLTLAAELHVELPALHIILMSANEVDVDRPTLDKAGIRAFVNKPMPPGPLLQAVQKLLEM